MKILTFLLILLTLAFGSLHKLDYELLKMVKERTEILTAKSFSLKSVGKDLTVRKVKILTKDGKVKVVNLSERTLADLMNDPNIVYIEAPRLLSLKNDIVRDISYGVHGNTSLTINGTNYFVYVNPSGVTTLISNTCTLVGQVLSSDLFQCSGPETLNISQDFRAVVIGVDKANISGYSEIYLVGTKGTLTSNDGTGVIVGVIDTGINFCHPAFLDANGNTRVKFFGFTMTQEMAYYLCFSSDPQTCCQSLGGNYDPTTWICEFDSAEINNKIQNNDCFWDYDGHGTHVAGTAAGSDSGSFFGTGIAPGADLVIFMTDLSDVDIIEGLRWIKRKAQELGKPAVVNMSLGGHYDPHDGTGLLDRKIDELSGPGFVVVVAAGNEGNEPIHAYTTKTSDFISIKVPHFAAIAGWYENPSRWRIEVCESGTQNCVGAISGSDMELPQPVGNTGCKAQVFASMVKDPLNKDGRFLILIKCIEERNLEIKLTQTRGYITRVDMWIFYSNSTFLSNNAKDPYGGYKFTVASPGTAKRAITVGAINSRPDSVLDQWFEWFGFDTFLNLGKIANFSSRGPTRDGRIKPNVVAGGAWVCSANAWLFPSFILDCDANGEYIAFPGTSMATPVVTGLVALYLQSNPQATPEDVKKWLTSNAERDVWDFGISYPNEIYGYGKAVWSDTVGTSGSSQDPKVPIPETVRGIGGGGGGGCSTVGSGHVLISLILVSFLARLRRWFRS